MRKGGPRGHIKCLSQYPFSRLPALTFFHSFSYLSGLAFHLSRSFSSMLMTETEQQSHRQPLVPLYSHRNIGPHLNIPKPCLPRKPKSDTAHSLTTSAQGLESQVKSTHAWKLLEMLVDYE